MRKYDHKTIEKKWQRLWEKQGLYETADEAKNKENFYALVEFPYPSGNLHVGHWYAFSVPDIFARAERMQGYNVLFPIGFDAFGLPAENAALKRGINPRKWTYDNIDYMRRQLRTMGACFDWSREIITCDPEYYKWTQWIFLQFFKKGLAYQMETAVNWCPSCKTVLANEQVIGGCCERCEHLVEQRKMKQWLLKITDYAEKLLAGLDKLDWPEEIKESQRNWIGRSEGLEEEWQVEGMKLKLKTFTTWPHTSWGSTFMVIAPEHPIINELTRGTKYEQDAKEFCQRVIREKIRDPLNIEKKKEGFFLGCYVLNHLNSRKMPLYIANFAIYEYGTGIVKCTPAHDQRDFEFAKKYNLEIIPVIYPLGGKPLNPNKMGQAYTGEGTMMNAGQFDGMPTEKAREAIGNYTIKQGNGRWTVNYKLRDWVISRQRYWGVPIPVVHCKDCGVQPVKEKDLPVLLPEIKDYKPKGDGKSPLAKVEKWVKVRCPKCGNEAQRETDTMDTFIDSSWYFLRYLDPKNKKEFASRNKMRKWMPVDRYSGGAEHTTMHLLYSRFWIKAMHNLGLLKWDEPYAVRRNRGLILGPDGQKMSKSRGNVVNPDEYVKELGADTVRMYLAFIGPYNEVGAYPWDPKGIMGIRRFIEKVWRLFENSKFKNQNAKLQSKIQNDAEKLLHKTIKKVTEDIEAFKFNTAISALMVLTNEMGSRKQEAGIRELETFLKLLAPFAPHITEELWHQLEHKTSIHKEPWPQYDKKLVKEELVNLPVQINGKLRSTIKLAADASEEEARELASKDKNVAKHLAGKTIKKVIYVKGKIINFVV